MPRLYEDKEAEILVVGCGNSGKDVWAVAVCMGVNLLSSYRTEREDV